MLKVVLDTVIFVRALINPFSNCGRILFAHSGRFRLIVAEALVRELLEVLNRPELQRKFRGLAGLDYRRVVEFLGQAEAVNVVDVPSVSRDPEDDKFLATCAAAEADFLVSEDEDLLVLREHGSTKIVNSSAFLEYLDSLSDQR